MFFTYNSTRFTEKKTCDLDVIPQLVLYSKHYSIIITFDPLNTFMFLTTIV